MSSDATYGEVELFGQICIYVYLQNFAGYRWRKAILQAYSLLLPGRPFRWPAGRGLRKKRIAGFFRLLIAVTGLITTASLGVVLISKSVIKLPM